MYWSELQTQLIGGLLKGSQTQATFFFGWCHQRAQGDMKQPTLFNLVRKIFYYSDVTIAVCECHEQKLRFEYYFKNEWDGYIRLPNARKHLKPWRRRPSGFIIVFEFLEITSPTKKISRNYHFNLFELWTCNLLGTRWCVTSEQTRCFTIHMVECRFGCPKTCEEEETCVASAIRMSTR